MEILEELWHGNIAPQEFNHIEDSPDYQNSLRLVNNNRERLEKGLSEYQNDLFERYTTSMDELNSQSELDAFKSGFKLATQILIAAVS